MKVELTSRQDKICKLFEESIGYYSIINNLKRRCHLSPKQFIKAIELNCIDAYGLLAYAVLEKLKINTPRRVGRNLDLIIRKGKLSKRPEDNFDYFKQLKKDYFKKSLKARIEIKENSGELIMNYSTANGEYVKKLEDFRCPLKSSNPALC